jgi:hypothetical protein
MTPVYKLSASSVTGRTNYGSMLAGNPVFLDTAFESIATVSVGSGGAATVTFSSIPQTFTHLQVRAIARGSINTATVTADMQFNNDTGSNYGMHYILGNGTAASVGSDIGVNRTYGLQIPGLPAIASVFGTGVIDILDYSSTSKYKTIRTLTGFDNNGSGRVLLRSGLWMSTSAISTIKLFDSDYSGNFAQYSTFALYGIKGA